MSFHPAFLMLIFIMVVGIGATAIWILVIPNDVLFPKGKPGTQDEPRPAPPRSPAREGRPGEQSRQP